MQKENKMGYMPIGRLILSMSLPMMLSMLMQALYNVVDSIYVARVSEDCLSALSLAFPAQNIMIGLGTGTGVGVSTLISRGLGAGDTKRAGRVAGTAIFLSICCWLLIAGLGLAFGANDRQRERGLREQFHRAADAQLLDIGAERKPRAAGKHGVKIRWA